MQGARRAARGLARPRSTSEEWPKVLNVLSRGGRCWPIRVRRQARRRGTRVLQGAHPEAYVLQREASAMNKNPYSGKHLHAARCATTPRSFSDLHAHGRPCTHARSSRSGATKYKPRFRSISMQSNSPIMRDMCAHNYIETQHGRRGRAGHRGRRPACASTNPTRRRHGRRGHGARRHGEGHVRRGVRLRAPQATAPRTSRSTAR